MDIAVTPTAERLPWVQNAWTLTDLLGRPLGSILEEPGRRFFIDPEGRGAALMAKVDLGPHTSLEEALPRSRNTPPAPAASSPDQA